MFAETSSRDTTNCPGLCWTLPPMIASRVFLFMGAASLVQFQMRTLINTQHGDCWSDPVCDQKLYESFIIIWALRAQSYCKWHMYIVLAINNKSTAYVFQMSYQLESTAAHARTQSHVRSRIYRNLGKGSIKITKLGFFLLSLCFWMHIKSSKIYSCLILSRTNLFHQQTFQTMLKNKFGKWEKFFEIFSTFEPFP